MEDNILKDGWSWMDEDLQLVDAEFPSAMPHCVWDDMVDNDAIVRSLFPSNSPDHVQDADPCSLAFPRQGSHDGNPAPLKRRRILEFDGGNVMDISSYLPDPQETSDDFLVEMCKSSQIPDPSSSNSVWFMPNEESLSSMDDAVEPSKEGWRIGCISDSDTSDGQEMVHCANNPPIKLVPKAMSEKESGLLKQTRNCTTSNLVHHPLQCLEPKARTHLPGNVRIKKASAQDDKTRLSRSPRECVRPVTSKLSKECANLAMTHTPKECASPVLAYPFALVKPIGIQGDITLQDINQRINTTPCREKACLTQPKSTLSSPYSGKSVLALTKIYTEGNGTITIMRTKG